GTTVSGYINPDFVTTSTTAPIVKAGFTVEIVGTTKSAVTDSNGYFEIKDVAAGTYTVKITKANYLTREIANVSVTADKELSTSASPILMWAGDMAIGGTQDGAINLEDILEICKAFNTSSTDAKYQVGLDLNRDGAISLEDVMIVAKHFGKVSSDY
uniref:Cellulosomal scaffoldin n=1 Tax=Acetivibrio cellulolyticus TaxID=35830 RepID=UPI0006C9E6A0|nr:Chain B, Cellulosomal scaffoldin [Acetivibrio cellulolyticus]